MTPLVVTITGGDEQKREILAREVYDHLNCTRNLSCQHTNCDPEAARRLDENYLERHVKMALTNWPIEVQTTPGPKRKK